jgi:hypothetical protein
MAYGIRGYEIDAEGLALEITEQRRTKAAVGRAIGRNGQYIQGLCKGRVRLAQELLKPLCDFLEIPEDQLLVRPRSVQDAEIQVWMDERAGKAGKASAKAAYGHDRRKCDKCHGEGWIL